MDRIYMNRIDGQRRIHIEILDNEISDLLDDLTTGPELFAATHSFLDVLRIAEETLSPVVAEGRRDRAARTAARQTTGQNDTDCPQCGDTGACNGGPCAHPAVGQPAEAHTAEQPLTADERKFLHFALDQAADEMAYGDGFTDEDRAALDSLRRRAGKDER